MTSGTPSPSDSPMLAHRPLLLSASITTSPSTVTTALTTSSNASSLGGRHLDPVVRLTPPQPTRRTETVRFEFLEDDPVEKRTSERWVDRTILLAWECIHCGSKCKSQICWYFACATVLERYPTLLFCENLMDFNEVHLHEMTLNFHTYSWFFSRLSIFSWWQATFECVSV